MNSKPVIALILGDTAGVGPEIVAKLLAGGEYCQCCRLLIIGDPAVLEQGSRIAGQVVSYQLWKEGQPWPEHTDACLLPIKHPELDGVVSAQVNRQCGAACIAMMEKAVELYRNGAVDAISYAPFNKGALQKADPTVTSETKLFARLLQHTTLCGELNMLDHVWTTRVTSHIPVSRISGEVNREKITAHILMLHETLVQAGYPDPKIGVAALNPHGGENGLCGREELDVIIPAMEDAAARGVSAIGPYPADILFIKAFDGEMDGCVTMYHDQGQIALKLKGFSRGVTIGGGFPVPITTCAHGTAYDIAGKGIANTQSLLNALGVAANMAMGQNNAAVR